MDGWKSITNFFLDYVQVRQKLTRKGYALWGIRGKPTRSLKSSKQGHVFWYKFNFYGKIGYIIFHDYLLNIEKITC